MSIQADRLTNRRSTTDAKGKNEES